MEPVSLLDESQLHVIASRQNIKEEQNLMRVISEQQMPSNNNPRASNEQ